MSTLRANSEYETSMIKKLLYNRKKTLLKHMHYCISCKSAHRRDTESEHIPDLIISKPPTTYFFPLFSEAWSATVKEKKKMKMEEKCIVSGF